MKNTEKVADSTARLKSPIVYNTMEARLKDAERTGILNVAYMGLFFLPILPDNLEILICISNNLQTIAIPKSLKRLDCWNNQLTDIPELPASLTYLNCGANRLCALPDLPPNLLYLHCHNNRIRSLPTLPTNLLELQCYGNRIDSLPPMPPDLKHLYCYNNQLLELPSLGPNVEFIDCFNNRLVMLPPLPSSLTHLYCGSNPWSKPFRELIRNANAIETVRNIYKRRLENRRLGCSLICLQRLLGFLTEDILVVVGSFLSARVAGLPTQIAALQEADV